MSSNNFLRIERKGDKFHVTECDADTEELYLTIGDFDSLEDAIKESNKVMQEEEIEYGLSIDI